MTQITQILALEFKTLLPWGGRCLYRQGFGLSVQTALICRTSRVCTDQHKPYTQTT